MSWAGWVFSLGTLLGGPGLIGADAPAYRTSRPIKSSDSSPNAQVKEECLAFSTFAVVSRVDPGIMGASMQVRPATEGSAPKAMCAAAGLQKVAIPLRVEAGYFWGAVGRFILVHSADDFGVLRGLTVYDSQDGRQMVDTEVNAGQGVKVVAKRADPSQVELRFNRRLELPCVISAGAPGDACWKLVREKNGIPDAVSLPAPRCPAVAVENANPNAVLQVTAPTRLVLGPDQGQAEMTFLPGSATCSATP